MREAARTEAPDAVRAAVGENLRELRERHRAVAADLGNSLRAAQEEFRTETEAVREAIRTETPSPGQEQPPGVGRAALVAELAGRIRADPQPEPAISEEN